LNESEDGIMRGSARSIEGLNITEAIAANKDLLRSSAVIPWRRTIFANEKPVRVPQRAGKSC